MKLLSKFLKKQEELFEYFGYKEDWRAIPIDSAVQYYWKIIGSESDGSVGFADSEEELLGECGNYYENEIYTQRFLPKWVYRGKEYTMIVVDTHVDGNKFLQIFDNKLERND